MRVLLDACVPQDFRHAIGGHDVATARYAGFAHLSNGQLLAAMAGSFDVLITTDKNLRHQQHMSGRSISIIVLNASGIRLPDLVPLVPRILVALETLEPGTVVEISGA